MVSELPVVTFFLSFCKERLKRFNKFLRTSIALCLLLLFCFTLHAAIIPPEQAFPLQVQADRQDIKVQWNIAPGYYLYHDRINFTANDLTLGTPQFPIGHEKTDTILGTYTVFSGLTTIDIPYFKTEKNRSILYIGYQGCASDGFCYPPQLKQVKFDFQGNGTIKININDYQNEVSSQDHFSNLLQQKTPLWALLIFLSAGLLLAFTPCVLPMIPILSSIILGQTKLSIKRAFLLSGVYVLGMAVTYAIAGMIAASLGASVQATLQMPWVITLFAILFIVLAAAMFGLYELRLPARLENYIAGMSQRQKRGHYLGALIMGILSSLIVSPCISAPLVGALVYIGQTGDAIFGGLALFFLAIGMGIPLIILATLGGKFLPRAGSWMIAVKHIAGFLLLALAIWTFDRILNPSIILMLCGLLALSIAVYLVILVSSKAAQRGSKVLCSLKIIFSLLFLTYAIIAFIGAARHHADPLKPWAKPIEKLHFIHVKSIQDVNRELTQAKGKGVLLDFYADWCVSCKLMERNLFDDPTIQTALKNIVLLQADVTANDQTDKALQKYYGVYAPPTIIMFDADGKVTATMVGEISKQELVDQLTQNLVPKLPSEK